MAPPYFKSFLLIMFSTLSLTQAQVLTQALQASTAKSKKPLPTAVLILVTHEQKKPLKLRLSEHKNERF